MSVELLGLNIGAGPVFMADMDPAYTRKFIAIVIHPDLRKVTQHQYGIHVEAMSDDLERLKNACEVRLRKEFPNGTIAFYERIDGPREDGQREDGEEVVGDPVGGD
jgi:hypothetical protein